jgi:mxaK protein
MAILPLVELAKQNYRDLLRDDPNQWDARYNLESALRLAPDTDTSDEADSPPPENRDHAPSTNDNARMDLP